MNNKKKILFTIYAKSIATVPTSQPSNQPTIQPETAFLQHECSGGGALKGLQKANAA